ncbi:MAG TPA: ribosome maturation factor RimP [Jatrophihabitantaceae bacterium]|jgi:ribosome maturation factor RimP|nr:ribosome maturation factor RimP [Jatrophihabitantaceae bacterium]
MPSATPASESRAALLELLAPVVAEIGLDLEDVTVQRVGRRSIVRVIVDSDDGVDLDDVAGVSHAVSEAMDAAAPGGAAFAGAYVLEVSSPGVDRPLTEVRHWRRAIGRLVAADVEGAPVCGRVLRADEAGVTFDVDGSSRAAGWAVLGVGRVQVEFRRDKPADVAAGVPANEDQDDDVFDDPDDDPDIAEVDGTDDDDEEG